MSDHPFNLQGDEYWTKPFKNDRDLAERTIFKDQTGFFIDGPPEVDLTVHDTIPVPIYTCFTQKEAFALPLARYAVVLAMRLENRQSFIGFAAPRDKPLPRTPPGTRASETAMVTGNMVLDLKPHLDRGDASGTYDVVVFLREHVSNRVRIAVKKTGGYADPEVAKFIAQQPLPAPEPVFPAPSAGAPLPSYRRGKTSPELPGSPGVVISAPRVTMVREGTQVDVSGSFRIPVLKRELTGASPGNDSPTAIIPITLIAFGTDDNDFGPFFLRMRVPTYDTLAPTDPVGTGFFAVNLLDFAGVPRKAATYFVYAFAGEWMSGPIAIGLATPDMLPK
jgi:hypothetical protein